MLRLLLVSIVTVDDRARDFDERLVICDPAAHYFCLGRTRVTAAQRAAHRAAIPFAHTVVDGFLPPMLLREAVRELHRLPSRVFHNHSATNSSHGGGFGGGRTGDDETTDEEQAEGKFSLSIPVNLRSLPRALTCTK